MPPRLSPTPAYTTNIELYGEADSAGLTPRTPYSRQAARAEEGRSRRVGAAIPVNESIAEDEDDGNLDEIDLLQTQSHPLLASSESTSFSSDNRHSGGSRWAGHGEKNRRWQWVKERLVKDRLPLGLIAGGAVAFLLLFMVVMSIKRPDALLDYIGVNSTAIAFENLDEESKTRFNGSTVIDYTAFGYTSYPLATYQYISECWKVTNDPRMKYSSPYWTPRPGAELDVLHRVLFMFLSKNRPFYSAQNFTQRPSSSPKTCTSSITYMLDGAVGLMADLAHLAQVAGFAREQNRTLFIYDDNWNRGRWTDHFLSFSKTQPGPEPGCAPPPHEGTTSCLSKNSTVRIDFLKGLGSNVTFLGNTSSCANRHWVTSARIDFFHLGNDFEETYEDPYKYTIERKKPIFDRAVESFAEAIWPSVSNQKLIRRARDELGELIDAKSNATEEGYVAAHIRRGDRKAMSWRYQKSPNEQVPTPVYIDAVWRTYSRIYNLSSADTQPSSPLLVYLATDSPSAASEFTELLTTNDSLVQTHGDEILEPIVYELRTSPDPELRSLAPKTEYVQSEWNNRTQEDRVRETRGMVVDWALLSGAWMPDKMSGSAGSSEVKPTAAICTLPSNVCKMAAVGLGWDRAFDMSVSDPGPDRRWIEIDNHGSIVPIWKAFEFFS